MFERKFSLRAVAPLVAVSLLFLITVVSFFIFNSWFNSVQQDKFSQVYSVGQVSDLKIAGVSTDSVFVISYVGESVLVYDVFVDNFSCLVSVNLTPNSLNEIYVGSCFEQYGNFSGGGVGISLRTSLGVFSRQVSFDGALSFLNLTDSVLEVLSSSEVELDSLVVKDNGGSVVCSFSGDEFVNYSNLVARWDFDGVVMGLGHGGEVVDFSGNGNFGKLYGDTKFFMDFEDRTPEFFEFGRHFKSLVLGLGFDSYSGGEVFDKGVYRNNGTLLNSPNCDVLGVLGNACSFNASLSQCVLVDANESLVVGSAFSVSVWVKPEATQGQYADILDFSHGNTPIDEGFVIQQESWSHNYFYFSFFGNDSSWHGNSKLVKLVPGVWQMLSFVYDDGRVFAYLNGEEYGEVFYDGSKMAPLHVENLTIGCMGEFIRYFNGSIDEVYLWNSSLSSFAIRELYEATRWKVVGDVSGFSRNVSGNTSTVLLFDFDEGLVQDRSFNGLKGNVSGAVWKDSGCVSGGCYEFDGVDDLVRINNTVILENQDFTMSAWFNSREWDNVACGPNQLFSNGFLVFGADTQTFRFGVKSSDFMWQDYLNSGIILSLNSWHFAVGVRKNNYLYLYLDGVLVAQSSGNLNNASISDFFMGGSHCGVMTGQLFNGSIDEVGIYSRALSGSEVLELYNSRKAEFVEFENGVFGEAMSFGGSSTKVVAENFTTSEIPTSISVWVKPEDLVSGQLFDFLTNAYAPANFGQFVLRFEGERLSFAFNNGSWVTNYFNTPIFEDVWYHVVVVSNGSKVRLFVDGVLDAEYSGTWFLNGTVQLRVSGQNYFNGSVDELGVYSVALSDAQVLELYRSRAGKFVEFENSGGKSSNFGARFVSNNSNVGVGYERMVVLPMSQLSSASSVSVFARVKLLGVIDGFRQVIGQGSWTAFSKFLLRVDQGNRFMFHVHSSSCSTGNCGELESESAVAQRWYNVLGRYDSGTGVKALFLNGNLSGSSSAQSGVLTDSNESYFVGSWEAGGNLGMVIDEILVFNGSLSDSQIKSLNWDYSKGLGVGRNYIDLRSCGLTIGSNYTIEVGYLGKVVGDSLIN